MGRTNSDVRPVDLPGLALPLLGVAFAVALHPQHKVEVLLGVLLLEKGAEESGPVGGLEQLVERGVPGPGLERAAHGGERLQKLTCVKGKRGEREREVRESKSLYFSSDEIIETTLLS